MTRQHRQSIRSTRFQALTPEYLLLLTIFGSSKTQRQVHAELDRRATLRPRSLRAAFQSQQLQPAA